MSRSLSQEKLAKLGEFERSFISKVKNGLRRYSLRPKLY